LGLDKNVFTSGKANITRKVTCHKPSWGGKGPSFTGGRKVKILGGCAGRGEYKVPQFIDRTKKFQKTPRGGSSDFAIQRENRGARGFRSDRSKKQ